ncbi:MAG: tetratricopeptide repeat protein [Candidatus Acidiferrales bacterium]
MRLRLANPAARWLFVIAVVLVAAALCWEGGKHALATHWANSADPQDWQRAAELEPSNAEHWYALGRYRQLDFENENLPLAISYYRRAIALVPESPYYWLDLASTYDEAGDAALAESAYQAAERDHPISAEAAWRYGNFLLGQGRDDQAYDEIHRGLLVEPQWLDLAVSRTWRNSQDVHVLLDRVLPDTPEARERALTFLVAQNQPGASLAVWQRIKERQDPVELTQAFPLVDLLIKQDEVPQAWRVWQQALAASGAPPGLDGVSRVTDGGFETAIADGGFGWRYTPQAGADARLDASEPHSGSHDLKLAFDGSTNVDFNGFYEYVPAEPSTRYHFSAYMRAQGLVTDGSVHFEISDPLHPYDPIFVTQGVAGIDPWTPITLDFETGPDTHVLIVCLRRPASAVLTKVEGTAWVDDVSLVPAATPSGATP